MILLTFTTLTLDTGYTNSCLFALSYCMPQEHLIGMFCLQLLVVGILIALTSRDALVAIDLCLTCVSFCTMPTRSVPWS